ncbi:NUDIX hydrolase [Rhodocaloribacter sp.]
MLLFYCVKKKNLDVIRREGIRKKRGVRLWTSLARARAKCRNRILVIDAGRLPAPVVADGEGWVRAAAVPAAAVRNLDPYLPPKPVPAAGGYVMRRGKREPELLLIFRRGVWDLPKGKCDAGETAPACALREVREEVGIDDLRILRDLGATFHGYARRGRYEVKTTQWFLMETSETRFTPQTDEDIEAVAWARWSKARAKVGFDTLRQHMEAVEPVVLETFGTR